MTPKSILTLDGDLLTFDGDIQDIWLEEFKLFFFSRYAVHVTYYDTNTCSLETRSKTFPTRTKATLFRDHLIHKLFPNITP